MATATLLALGVAPAVTASAAPADTVLRGTVTDGASPQGGVRVGTWSPSRGTIATTTTDSHGAFTLRSPSWIPVDVWAGTPPTADRAVFPVGDRELVRGVIGRGSTRGRAGVLWQRVDAAVPRELNGGHALQFRLQEAGRFTSTVASGGDGSIALVRGSDTADVIEARDGRIVSGWLVPGTYRVRWNADQDHLAVTTEVRLASGTRAIGAPALPAGSTVTIRATCNGAPVVAGVHAIERVGPDDQDAGATDSGGVITLRGVTPGRHRFLVGRGAAGGDGAPVVPLTDDRYLPSTVVVDVLRGQATTVVSANLQPAAHITGRVLQPAHHPVIVLRLPSGNRYAAVRGRGQIHGSVVPIRPSLVGPRIENEEFAGAPGSTDVYATEPDGRGFSASLLPAGEYRIGDLDALPLVDGPWYYTAPQTTFRLPADRTVDLGAVPLRIAG